MNWKIRQAVDLSLGYPGANVWQEALMVPGDGKAHEWRVEIREDGQPVNLAGCAVNAWFARDDGNAVYITGTTDENTATAVLTRECYAIPGTLRGIMKISRDGSIISVCETYFTVREPLPGQTVDPGETIPSVEELLDKVRECEAAAEAAEQAVVDANAAVASANTAAGSANNAATAANDAAEGAIEAASTADAATEAANTAVQQLGDANTAKKAAEAAQSAAAQSASAANASAAEASSSATAAAGSSKAALESAQNAAASEIAAAESEAAAQASEDAVGAMIKTIAKEPTAQEILLTLQQEFSLLTQIVNDGIPGSGNLNGFSFSRGGNDELIISYANPEDDSDTASAIFATKTQAAEIAQTLSATNELLRSMVITEEMEV